MPAEIVASLIAASGAIVLAGATYWFTKKRDEDADFRFGLWASGVPPDQPSLR